MKLKMKLKKKNLKIEIEDWNQNENWNFHRPSGTLGSGGFLVGLGLSTVPYIPVSKKIKVFYFNSSIKAQWKFTDLQQRINHE